MAKKKIIKQPEWNIVQLLMASTSVDLEGSPGYICYVRKASCREMGR